MNKRFGNGLSVIGAYTYSKAMGIGGNLFGDQSRQQDRRNRAQEYAPLDFNQTQRLTLAWIYELPFGKGKPFGSNLIGVPANAGAGGWSLQGIYTAHTGFPLSPLPAHRSTLDEPMRTVRTAPATGIWTGDQRTIRTGLTPLVSPTIRSASSAIPATTSSSGRASNDMNLTAMKNTPVDSGEREHELQFRAEFFNAFNHANFGDPGTDGQHRAVRRHTVRGFLAAKFSLR